MSALDWKLISAELQKPLNPKNVKPAPKGKFGEYVDGYHVVTEANRIFGEDGWSYTVTRIEKVSEQTVSLRGQNGPYEQYRVGYMATVRVDVGGVVREGCAVGSGVGSPLTIADHHESAVKEAETDALKRALRCFGNTFGLALYEKAKTNVRPPDEPDPKAEFEASVAAAIRGIEREKSADGLAEFWKDLATNQRYIARDKRVIDAKDARKAALLKPANADLGNDEIPY